MNFGDFLKMLHPYLGPKMDKVAFFLYFQTVIMREPSTQEEKQADMQEEYYPYGEKSKDSIYKIYSNKQNFPKDKGLCVLRYYSPTSFIKCFDSVINDSRNSLINELKGFGVSCTYEELPKCCEEILHLLVEAAAKGEGNIDLTSFEPQESTFPVYDDSELKKKYGVNLLTEVDNRCPYDGCFKYLTIGSSDQSMSFDYTIVRINPRITKDTTDNLIALCPECARGYQHHLTAEKQERLENIKLRLLAYKDAMDTISAEKLVPGIEQVIRKIPNIPLERVIGLNYNPTEILKKIDKKDHVLFMKINNYVMHYYLEVADLFKIIKDENGFNFDKFSCLVKLKYIEIRDTGVSQARAFQALVDWLSISTNEDREPCEVIISYFVQKCEVYDAIPG